MIRFEEEPFLDEDELAQEFIDSEGETYKGIVVHFDPFSELFFKGETEATEIKLGEIMIIMLTDEASRLKRGRRYTIDEEVYSYVESYKRGWGYSRVKMVLASNKENSPSEAMQEYLK